MPSHATLFSLKNNLLLPVGLALFLSACGVGGGGSSSSTTTCPPATALLPDVTALFLTKGVNWNDFLTGDDWRAATDACIADDSVSCLHGGERRFVEVTGKTDCDGLAAKDGLGAFDWVCDDSVSPVRMVSTGFTKGKSLSDLIDFTTPGFKTNKVTVYDHAVAWGATPGGSNWWTNPDENKYSGSAKGVHDGGSITACAPATNLLPDVTALFPTNGANWNDYLTGEDWNTASDATCNADSGVPCLHGGERRVVDLTGKTACTGLTAADDFGAFDWVCDASVSPVRMVSTGLVKGKSLSDLIDFTTPGFKANKVTVYDNDVIWGVTPSSAWWTNLVEINNAGGSLINQTTDPANPSTIYLVTGDTIANYTLDAHKVGLVIRPGFTLTGKGILAGVISSSNQDYLWIEGSINASVDDYGVNLTTRYSTLRQLTANNAIKNGVFLNTASNNTLVDVSTSNNGSIAASDSGVLLSNSSNNRLTGVTASNNTFFGVLLSSSSNNTLAGVTASNNSNYGVYLTSNSNNNTLVGVTASSNTTAGIFLSSASNNILTGVTASSNTTAGIFLSSASNNTLTGVTTSNNNYGVLMQPGSNNTTLTNVTASNNNTGVVLTTVSNNKFTGLLKVGNNGTADCLVTAGTLPGLDNNTCANNGSSDAASSIGATITLATSFVGKVSSDDVANISDDILGGAVASFPASPESFDWSQFDNPYRAWGKDSSSDFPNADHRGRWTNGAGRIWDWSLRATDSVNRAVVVTLPTGEDTITHTWSDATVTTFLKNAVEIPADGIGNDNSLCESGETCLFTPNIGSYQGSGALVSAGAFTDGTLAGGLTGITLMKFTQNGE